MDFYSAGMWLWMVLFHVESNERCQIKDDFNLDWTDDSAATTRNKSEISLSKATWTKEPCTVNITVHSSGFKICINYERKVKAALLSILY